MRFNSILVAALPVLGSAQVFPAPEGEYKIQWINSELVDESRQDPFNETHARRMMISRFVPVPKDQCEETCKVPYLSPEMGAIEDEIMTEAVKDRGIVWPKGMLEKLEVETCCKVAEGADLEFPTLLYGPGLNTTRLFYTAVGQNLASLGYEIIVMDHPYETDAVQFPNGEIIYGGNIAYDPDDLSPMDFGLEVRAQDVSFVLDHFNLCNTTYMGHSYGGASACRSVRDEPRITSGANLDGTIWGNATIAAGSPVPFLLFGSTLHNSSNDEGWLAYAEGTEEQGAWLRELGLADSLHSNFGDWPAIGDVTGLRERDPVMRDKLFGNVTGERVAEIYRAYVGGFVDFTLLGGEEGLLKAPSPKYPDVLFKR